MVVCKIGGWHCTHVMMTEHLKIAWTGHELGMMTEHQTDVSQGIAKE